MSKYVDTMVRLQAVETLNDAVIDCQGLMAALAEAVRMAWPGKRAFNGCYFFVKGQ
jgi:hypothetical protein